MGVLAHPDCRAPRQAPGRPRRVPRTVVGAAADAALGGPAGRPVAADAVAVAVRCRPQMPAIVMARLRTHWTRERRDAGRAGVGCFYITYVSYRNLKSFLPFVLSNTKYDRELHLLDRALMLGNDPAVSLHSLLGQRDSRALPLLHLPLVPSARAAGPDRLAGLVAQHLLRLLVRHLPVHRLDAWAPCPTTCCRHWARASSTSPSTPTCPTPPPAADGRRWRTGATKWSTAASKGVVQSVAGFASLHCGDHAAGGADGAVHAAQPQ